MSEQSSSGANDGSSLGSRFNSKQQGNYNTSQAVGSASNSTIIGSIVIDYDSKRGRLWTEVITTIGKYFLLHVEVDEVVKRLEALIRERLPVLTSDEGHLPVREVQIAGHIEGPRAALILFYDIDHSDAHLHVQNLGSVPVVMHVDNTTIHPSVTYSFYAQEGVHITHEPLLHLGNGSSSDLYGPEAWSADTWRRGDVIRPFNAGSLHNSLGNQAHQQLHYATSAAVAVDPSLLTWDDELIRTFVNDPNRFATQIDDWLDDAVDAADAANAHSLHPNAWPGLSLDWHHGPELTKIYPSGIPGGHTDPTLGHDPHTGHTDPTLGHDPHTGHTDPTLGHDPHTGHTDLILGHELLLGEEGHVHPTHPYIPPDLDDLPEHLL